MSKKENYYETIECLNDLTYNKSSDCYIFYSKKLSKNLVIKGEVFRDITRNYSNLLGGEGSTITELSRSYSIPRDILTELIKAAKLTHDELPYTKEEIENKNVQEITGDLLELKKFRVVQEFNKKSWHVTQSNALKWMEFEEGILNPLKSFFKKWKAPEFKSIPESKFAADKNGKVFVCGAFDWHYGSKAEKRYMFRKDDWNSAKAAESIQKYVEEIGKSINNSKSKFEKIVILLGGDLFDSITSFTEKGTPLKSDTIRDTQFDGIFNCLTNFISQLIALFPNVELHFIRGNHGGTFDYTLGKGLQSYFRNEKRLKFNLYSSRTAAIRVKDVLLLLDHGASDKYKSKTPKGGKARESYIQSLLLSDPQKLIGIKQKIFVQGDLHHFQQHEYNDFEFFMFGALPTGSEHADHGNWHARPRQNCLIIGDNGVDQVLHYYFD